MIVHTIIGYKSNWYERRLKRDNTLNCMSIINYEGSSSIKTCFFFCLGDLLAQSAPFIVTPFFLLAIFQPPWLPLLLPLLNLSCRLLTICFYTSFFSPSLFKLLLHKLSCSFRPHWCLYFYSLSFPTASTPWLPSLLLNLSFPTSCLLLLLSLHSTQTLLWTASLLTAFSSTQAFTQLLPFCSTLIPHLTASVSAFVVEYAPCWADFKK